MRLSTASMIAGFDVVSAGGCASRLRIANGSRSEDARIRVPGRLAWAIGPAPRKGRDTRRTEHDADRLTPTDLEAAASRAAAGTISLLTRHSRLVQYESPLCIG